MTFEDLERCLREALGHLYDPAFRPADELWAVLGCDPQPGSEQVQAALIRSIEDMKPGPDVPPFARAWRVYDLLTYRYTQGLTQEETAERLNISSRHLRREQHEATNALAQRLWEHWRAETPVVSRPAKDEGERPIEPSAEATQATEWRSQVREELAALEKNAPGAVANVAETIRGTLELEQVLASRHRIELSMEGTQPDLAAAIHPSALRQVLVAVINTLIKHTSSGRIAIAAECTKARVFITVTGPAALTDKPSGSDLIQEILASHGGSIEIRTSDGLLSFRLELPRAEQITVLVVDDNLDLAHFYQRFLAGTRYRIVHVAQGQRVLETVETVAPDIIVLDVMLADIDGWEVLTYLHEHPATRSIPVIVCSVSREEELALALGATLYLPKPVRRAQFVQALDRALRLVASPDRTPLESSEPTA